MDKKEAYELYSQCKNCTSYNTSKCLTCKHLANLYKVTEVIMDMFYDDYKKENNIVIDQFGDNYEFESAFEKQQEINNTEDKDIVDVEVVEVE